MRYLRFSTTLSTLASSYEIHLVLICETTLNIFGHSRGATICREARIQFRITHNPSVLLYDRLFDDREIPNRDDSSSSVCLCFAASLIDRQWLDKESETEVLR